LHDSILVAHTQTVVRYLNQCVSGLLRAMAARRLDALQVYLARTRYVYISFHIYLGIARWMGSAGMIAKGDTKMVSP